MIPIRNYDPWVIRAHWNYHRFCIVKRINFTSVYDCPNFQETEQYLVLSLQDNMIRGSNSLLFFMIKNGFVITAPYNLFEGFDNRDKITGHQGRSSHQSAIHIRTGK